MILKRLMFKIKGFGMVLSWEGKGSTRFLRRNPPPKFLQKRRPGFLKGLFRERADTEKAAVPIGTTAFSDVGENLFSRAVTSQVSSAQTSLTSVFGMGTGGPSLQSTPTIQFAPSRLGQLHYVITTR